ncbi:MAG: sugar phosphate isomerase/epimerase [Clostridia bacterium]|nr:sugar phosphate isomerase/epimerase [Clostridia bacterium]
MKIGISTGCLYPMLTEDCICELLQWGFDSIEIFFNTFSELEEPYLAQLKDMLDRHGAVVRSIHPFTSSYESFLLFSAYERRFDDGVRLYEMYYRAAARLGAKKVVLHGLREDFHSALPVEEYFRRFAVLQQRAAEYGVTLLQENVNRFISNRIDFVRQMKEKIPQSAAFVCDIKQAHLGGIRPVDMVCAMGSSLKHIHINDFSADDRCVLPGCGVFDYKEFFDNVQKTGFDGDVMIEVYRFSYDKLSELRAAYDYLTAVCSEYGGEYKV